MHARRIVQARSRTFALLLLAALPVLWLGALRPLAPASAAGGPVLGLHAVTGTFFANAGDSGAFDSTVATPVLWTQTFPLINFNGTTAPGCGAGVSDLTRPLTDVELSPCQVIPAQDGTATQQAGVGAFSSFQAAFVTDMEVSTPGTVTFSVTADDGWVAGFGPDVVGGGLVTGDPANPMTGAPVTTGLRSFSVVAASNVVQAPATRTFNATFPAAGAYTLELDYSECCAGSLELSLAYAAPGASTPAPIPAATAGVTLTKALVSPAAPVPAGSTVTYSLTLDAPAGNTENVTQLSVSDALPAPLTNVAVGTASQGSASVAPGTSTVTWAAGDLVPGGSASLTVTATVPPHLDPGGSVSNTATYTGTAGSGSSGSPLSGSSNTVASGIQSAPAVTATVVAPSTAVPSQSLTYTLTVANGSGAAVSTAYGTAVSDTLPASLSTVAAGTPSQGTATVSGNTVQWSVGDLAAGASATLAVTATAPPPPVDNGTQISDVASWQATTLSGGGSTVSGSSAAATTTISTTASTVLAKAQVTPAGGAAPGQSITYSLTLSAPSTNTENANGLTVTDPLPVALGGVTLGAPSAGTTSYDAATSTVTWTVGTLAAGQQATMTVTGTVAAHTDPRSITNTATYAGTAGAGPGATPLTGSSNPVSTPITSAPALSVDLSGPSTATPGSPVSYTLSLADGAGVTVSTAHGTTVTDVLPAQLHGVSVGTPTLGTVSYNGATNTVTWSAGDVAPGVSATLGINANVASPLDNGSTFSDSASWTASTLPSGGTAVNGTSNAVTTTVSASASIVLAKADSQAGTVAPGSPLTYTVTVTAPAANGENVTAVTVTDPLPAQLSGAVLGTPTLGSASYDAATSTVTWDVGTLAPGASASLAVTGTVAPHLDPGTVVANTAHYTASTGTGAGTAALSGDSPTVTNAVQSAPQVTLDVSGPATAVPGGALAYTMTVANGGAAAVSAAYSVAVTDQLPATVGAVAPGTPSQGTASYDAASNTVTWTVGTLTPGASATLQVQGTLATPLDNGTVVNDAGSWTASTLASGGTALNGSSATVHTTVSSSASLSLVATQTAPAGAVTPGGTLAYQLALSSPSGSTENANGVVVTDVLPAQLTAVFLATPSQGAATYDIASNTVTWTVGTLTPGAGATLAINATVRPHTDPSPIADSAHATGSAGSGAGATPLSADSNVVSTPVASAPAVTLTMSGPATTTPGQPFTYGITAANGSGAAVSTAYGTVVTDALPASAGSVSVATPSQGTATFDPATNTVTWTVGDLADAQTPELLVTVTVPTPTDNGTTFTDVASYTASTLAHGGSPLQGNSNTVTTTVVSSATTVLAKAQTSPSGPVTPGGSITYQLSVSAPAGNTENVHGLTVTDTLPAQLGPAVPGTPTLGSVVVNTGTNTVTWTVGDLVAGQGTTLSITAPVKPNIDPSPISNSASYSGTAGAGPGATALGGISNTVVTPVQSAAAPALSKSGPGSASPGTPFSYGLTVTNGVAVTTSTFYAVVVTDQLPAAVGNAVLAAPSRGTATYDAATNTVTWTVGDLAPGDAGTLTITVTPVVADNGTQFANTASFSGSTLAVGGSPLAGSSNTVTTTIVAAAGLLIDKAQTAPSGAVPAGAPVTYTITVTAPQGNTEMLHNAVVTDPFVAQLTPLAPGTPSQGSVTVDAAHNTVVWSVGDMAPGAVETLSIVATVAPHTDPVTLSNTAHVAATAGSGAGSTPVNLDSNTTQTQVQSAPGDGMLDITQPATGAPGQSLAPLTLMLTNSGAATTSNAYEVVVTDPLPAQLGNPVFGPVPQGTVTYDIGTNTITWNVGTVAAGQSLTFTYSATMSAPLDNGTAVTRFAYYFGSALPNGAHDNCDSPPLFPSICGGSEQLSTTATSSADVLLAKAQVPAGPVPAGGPLTYTVTATASAANTENANAVVVTDPLPAQITGASASVTGGTATVDPATNTVTWTLGTMAPGAAQTLTVNGTVAPHLDPVPLANVAAVSGTAGSGAGATPITGTSNTVTTPVQSAPQLTLAKSAPSGGVPGQVVRYTLTLSNAADAVVSTAHHVLVTDPLPAQITSATLSATSQGTATYDATTNTVHWAAGDVAPGASATVQVAGRLAAVLNNGTVVSNTATWTARTLPSGPADLNGSSAEVTTTVSSSALLSLVKTQASPAGPVPAGSSLTYVLTASAPAQNTETITGLVVTDPLPAPLTGLTTTQPSVGTVSVSGGTVTWTIGTMNPGDTASVSVTARVPAHADPALLVNVAHFVGTGGSGASTLAEEGDSDAVTSQVQSGPQITITQDAPASARGGQPVTYTLTVGNGNGPTVSSAYGLAITDVIPAQLNAPVFGTPPQGSIVYDPATRTMTWTVGTLLPGASLSLPISGVFAGGAHGLVTNAANYTAATLPSGGGPVAGGVQASTTVTASALPGLPDAGGRAGGGAPWVVPAVQGLLLLAVAGRVRRRYLAERAEIDEP